MPVIALCIYTAILFFILGTIAGSNSYLLSHTGCITAWIKDYQTLIASAAVIFTLVTAKQQLDANRRQHVAMVKRSLMERLDALSEAEEFSNEALEYRVDHSRTIAALTGSRVITPSIPNVQLNEWQKHLPFDLLMTVRSVDSFAYGLKSALDEKDTDQERVENRIRSVRRRQTGRRL